MAIPLSRLLFDPRAANTPAANHYRMIENHYHLAMAAESIPQLCAFYDAFQHLQVEHARLNLCAMDRIGNGIDQLNDTATATLNAVEEQTDVLRGMAQSMFAQQKTLREIASILRQLTYRGQMLELREEADKWLISGMRNTGQARADDYDDAMPLLREVIKNPIGNQDYVTWFQIGWLLWKQSSALSDAEQAFYRASRLVAPHPNQYYSLSVRHLAYMHYLQGRHEDAYQTVQKAIAFNPDADSLFDAARYAAKTGRKAESLRLLERCIDLVPTTIITMFAEEDFTA